MKEGSRFGVGGYYQRSVSFPEWLLLLPGALPVSLLVAWVCRRLWAEWTEGRVIPSTDDRLIHEHCPNCDYDLTGNVSGICPECGTKIAASPQSSPRPLTDFPPSRPRRAGL